MDPYISIGKNQQEKKETESVYILLETNHKETKDET